MGQNSNWPIHNIAFHISFSPSPELQSLDSASQVVLVVKNPPANAGAVRDMSLIPGTGRSPGGGHGNPLQYSCLENPKDRGAWRVTVHRVAKSQKGLKQHSKHTNAGKSEDRLCW